MSVAIINYGSGNLRSVAKAFERQQAAVQVTDDPQLVARADHIVLPGVGAFADCARGLAALDGMSAALREAVVVRGRPFLGICVGMQLLADEGLEHGRQPGLGWIGGAVVEIPRGEPPLKIPHMGWNEICFDAHAGHPLFSGIGADRHAYFVHSYHLAANDGADVMATVDYGGPVTAAVGRGNIFGVQFHPEKSQALGLKLIGNFLNWRP